MADPCIGNDPGCPCQDGLACHYRDIPGSRGWAIPKLTGTVADIADLDAKDAAPIQHASDCAINAKPAYAPGVCDCMDYYSEQ